MNKELFYKYDLYALEQIYPTYQFVEYLDKSPLLYKSVKPFIKEIADLLYLSITEKKKVEIKKITPINIDRYLDSYLSKNPVYKAYDTKKVCMTSYFTNL